MLATASGLFGSTPGYVTDGHPFFAVGVDKGKFVHERSVAYLTKPDLPPSSALNEPIEVLLNVLPGLVAWNIRALLSVSDCVSSTLTCGGIAREEREDMRIDNINCGQYLCCTVMFLEPIRHLADSHWDLEVRQRSFSSLDLLRQLRGVQGPIV